MATTIAPATPIETSAVPGVEEQPERPIATVSPLKMIARPAVAMVVRERVLDAVPGAELFAEPRHDEQRIVDGDAEADQRDDVHRVCRYVDDVSQRERCADTTEHGENADAETEQGGDAGGEHDDQQDQCKRAAKQPRSDGGRLQGTCQSRTRAGRHRWR